MKILFQWAQRDPTDWLQIDSSLIATLPARAVPNPGQIGGQNNVLGWINDVCIQGLHFNGSDHIGVEDVVVGLEAGVRVTNWWDDPIDNPPPERRARVWTILPLAPDPNLGNAINIRQSQVVYAEGPRFTNLSANPPQNTVVLPWANFVPPAAAITRHQVQLTDAKYAEHTLATRSYRGDPLEWGWRDWVEHLPDSEVLILPGGRRILKDQRPQGRYKPSEFTLTWFQRNTDKAVGFAISTHEDALLATAGAGETESVTTDSGAVRSWAFTTPTSEPNSGDWPNGTYRCQLDCTAASGGLTYAVSPFGGGGFRRISSDTNTSLEQLNQAEADFSGTGLKLATVSWDPSAGAVGDLYCPNVWAQGDSHGDAITLRFSADAWADGPWPALDAGQPTMRRWGGIANMRPPWRR